MTARRAPAAHLCLRVGARHQVAFVPFPARAPMFVIGAAGTYDDAPPILTINDGPAEIAITNPGRGEVTEEDVRFGRLLAEAVNLYAAELEKHAAKDSTTAAGTEEPAGQAA